MNLSDHIVRLPFVGPTYAKRLEKLGINTIEDLLIHFPFRYDDFSVISPINWLQVGEIVTVLGRVEKFTNTFTKTGKKLQTAEISDNTGKISAIWFNQMFLSKSIKKGEEYYFSGKAEWFGSKKVLMSPEHELKKAEMIHTGRLVPVYNETYGVSSKWLRSRIRNALIALSDKIDEFLPENIINSEKLLNEAESIRQIHFPKDKIIAQKAKERLAFDELYLIQLSSLIRKKEWEKSILGKQFFIDFEKSMKFVENLPFSLTAAQKKCIKEILLDLQKNKPMNRLLQGDVGSGKTVVAAMVAYTAFLNNCQTLFMAPTEILANQHFATLKSLLEPFGVPIELITGSNKPNRKKVILTPPSAVEGSRRDSSALPQNDKTPKIIVGTHAILYQDFSTENVGLVIVDEQHRFGVEQRALLSKKGKSPHFLTMTATPIPRTIALTLYNDLDLSVIDELPKGRIQIKTWVVPKEKRDKAYEWIRTRIKSTPEQAFIICPLIDESEAETLTNVKAATKEFESLSKEIFPDLRLGILHGRMKAKEKDEILAKFKEGCLDILVATPVVEVGIDIPNATIMVIEAADHFGLAQLHQLRGRVGRSNLQSYCLLFTDNENPKTVERLKYLENTNIGMELAEIDLRLRGPGEIFGTSQHGYADLRVASFSDLELIQKTRAAAVETLTTYYSLLTTNDSPLKKRLEKYTITQLNTN